MKAALRLRQSCDYDKVRQEGRLYRHPVLLLGLRDNELPYNRYGFVVGKSIGTAVQRNRCRRRLRELIGRLHQGLAQGYDIVIVAKPPAIQQPFSQLQRILNAMFRRARLLKVA